MPSGRGRWAGYFRESKTADVKCVPLGIRDLCAATAAVCTNVRYHRYAGVEE